MPDLTCRPLPALPQMCPQLRMCPPMVAPHPASAGARRSLARSSPFPLSVGRKA